MPYASGRTIHDADAHIMETPTWLRGHADPQVRDRVPTLDLSSGNELRQTGDPEVRERIAPLAYTSGNELRQTGDPAEQLADLEAAFDRLAAKHASDEYRATEAEEIMRRKNFAATG